MAAAMPAIPEPITINSVLISLKSGIFKFQSEQSAVHGFHQLSLGQGRIPHQRPLPPPSQLPNVYNKLQQLHVDVRHRLTNRLAATFSYLYEPFRVYDFAFDPSVVNGIVQPSSLVLGYVYRPYTANSFVFGVRYFW